jgi:enoyl-CoA hydratase/carnithine racemase
MALGFRKGTLELAEELGAEKVRELCLAFEKKNPGFPVPTMIREARLPSFAKNILVEPATKENKGIATIRVFRPEVKNALSKATLQEIDHAVKTLEADTNVRGIVLTSTGGELAGADILELAVLPDAEACKKTCLDAHPILARIEASKKPIVAAVDGPVMGGGAELSMSCHARVVGPSLMLAQPEVNLGIIPGYGGTMRLPRLIGFARAIDLLRTGRPVGAADAVEWGWATGAPSADPEAAARALIEKALAGDAKIGPVDPAPVALPESLPRVDIGHRSLAIDAILVDVLRNGLKKPLAEGLVVEAEGFARCRGTVDMDIGMKNFVQNGPRVPAAFLHE